jgi:hypothetical protein
MDPFFFQLAVIFLPGLVWERVVTKYGLKRPPSQFETILRTFTFGLAAYAITFGLYAVLGRPFYFPDLQSRTFIADTKYLAEFGSAFVVAFVGSVVWLYAFRWKILGKFFRFIRATKKYGDEDLWDYIFNSSDARVEYVYVRDYDAQKVFSGWVVGFSETDKVRELLLRDVEVYNLEGKQLYTSPLLYVGRPPDKVDVEFPVTA